MNDSRSQGLYPKETIANLLNVSERRIEQLAQKKIIPKAGRGVFDLGPTVTAYIRYLQGLCSGAIKTGEPSELDRRLLEARVLERESKARQAKYRADMLEQEISDRRLRREMKKIPQKVSERLEHCFCAGLREEMHRELIMREISGVIDEILESCDTS